MLKMNAKQLLAVLLSVLLVHPMQVGAAPVVASSGSVLGSINSRGIVRIGETTVPGMSTLFSGDAVRTDAGSALIQYSQGSRVILGGESTARFTAERVELQKGQMSFNTTSGGPAFAASTLRLEPTSAKSAANVTLGEHKAAVAVTEGSVKVVDPSGAVLVSLNAGEARLFEEALAPSASPAAAAPAAAAPQGGSNGNGWLIALGIGLVGTSLGIAALLKANDAEDRVEEAGTRASAASAQVAQLQSTVSALTTQINSLQGQVTTLRNAVNASNPALANLTAALVTLNNLEAQLLSAQSQLNQLLTAIAAQGGVATPAQLSQLQSLTSLVNSLFAQVQAQINVVNNLANQLRGVLSGV